MDYGTAVTTAKTPWPKTLLKQIAAVRTALTNLGTVHPCYNRYMGHSGGADEGQARPSDSPVPPGG